MKNSMKIVVAGLVLVSASALGIFRPGWDRPIMKASAVISSASSFFADYETTEVVLTRKDGSHLYGLRLNGMLRGGERYSSQFYFVQTFDPGCGSTGRKYARYFNGKIIEEAYLVDHTTRMCRDVVPYLRELRIERSPSQFIGTADGEMELGLGRWSPVYSILSL